MIRTTQPRVLRGLVCAVVLVVAGNSSAFAHDPIEYDVPAPWLENPPAGNVLKWKFASGVPTWLQTPVNDAINYQSSPYDNSLWNSFQYNNSNAPNFSKDASATGRVVYTAAPTGSPCTGSPIWLMCAKLPDEPGFSFQIRDLANSPLTGTGGQFYRWEDQGIYGASTNLLLDVGRNMLHEGDPPRARRWPRPAGVAGQHHD